MSDFKARMHQSEREWPPGTCLHPWYEILDKTLWSETRTSISWSSVWLKQGHSTTQCDFIARMLFKDSYWLYICVFYFIVCVLCYSCGLPTSLILILTHKSSSRPLLMKPLTERSSFCECQSHTNTLNICCDVLVRNCQLDVDLSWLIRWSESYTQRRRFYYSNVRDTSITLFKNPKISLARFEYCLGL